MNFIGIPPLQGFFIKFFILSLIISPINNLLPFSLILIVILGISIFSYIYLKILISILLTKTKTNTNTNLPNNINTNTNTNISNKTNIISSGYIIIPLILILGL